MHHETPSLSSSSNRAFAFFLPTSSCRSSFLSPSKRRRRHPNVVPLTPRYDHHHRLRRYCKTAVAAVDDRGSPKVKSSFYKNPSRAIEKGGGFYIPGLRGPRLRFFVSTVASVLLVLNHSLSPGAFRTETLRTSEILASFATLSVFFTALYDSTTIINDNDNDKQGDYNDSKDRKINISSPITTTTTTTTTATATATATADNSTSTTNWALNACIDLTSVTHIAAFKQNVIALATDNIEASKPCGQVVQRVQQEQKSLFVKNTADLPPDITLPFLGDGSWTVFVVPTATDSVVVFAKQKDSGDGFELDTRRWLEAFAPRLYASAN